MIKRLLSMTAAVFMILTLAVGCSQNSEEMSESDEDIQEITLCESWSFESGFSTIVTPENNTNYALSFYLANFYETLVNYEAGRIVPGLAESWSVSEDGLVYTFNLREDVKFSDGADFNAAVVKKNLAMRPDLLGDYKAGFEMISLFKEAEIIDEHVIAVHLTSPYYGTLQEFAKPMPLGMMSPNAFNEDGTLSDKLLTHSLGTGPYMSAGQSAENIYTFVRNPYYGGEKPEVDRFNVRVIPDNDAKALALRNNEIDLIFGASKISHDGFREFSEDRRYTGKVSAEKVITRFLGFNVSKEPFNDKQVRLAVSHAIDKESIAANLFYGLETKADNLLSRSLPYCDLELEPYAYNMEKARQLLEAAGWIDADGDGIREKGGQELAGEILYKSGMAVNHDLALTIASSLKEIGMEIRVTDLDMLAWHVEVQGGNYTIAHMKTYGIPFDPYLTISHMGSEPLIANKLAQGFVHVQDGNSIIKGVTGMVDEQEIQQQYDFILNEIHQNVSFVPISYIKELVVFNGDKIADYRFHGLPSQFDAAGIKLR